MFIRPPEQVLTNSRILQVWSEHNMMAFMEIGRSNKMDAAMDVIQ